MKGLICMAESQLEFCLNCDMLYILLPFDDMPSTSNQTLRFLLLRYSKHICYTRVFIGF